MKVYLYIALLLLVNQGVIFSQQADQKKAKSILGKTTKALNSISSVKIDFSLELKYRRKGKVFSKNQKGNIYFNNGKYRVNIGDKSIFSNSTTTWTYNKEDKEIVITENDDDENYMSPSRLLTNFYDKDFLYKYNGNKTILNSSCYELELTPYDKTKPFHKIYLYINTSNYLIKRLEILENTSNRVVLTIDKISSVKNKIVEKKTTFNPKEFPKTEIIDLR